MLQHCVQAATEKQVEDFIQADLDAAPRQGFAQAAAAQELAVDQHAIAVENDEMGPHHRLGENFRCDHILPERAIAHLAPALERALAAQQREGAQPREHLVARTVETAAYLRHMLVVT